MLTHLLKSFATVAVLLTAACSCSTPKDITYFQDLQEGARREVSAEKEMVVRPDDYLNIMVHSRDEKLMELFNIVDASHSTSMGENLQSAYHVDSFGDIEFPILGTLHIAGMKRTEVADYIKKELVQRNLIKDPTVLVSIIGRRVNVLGDVNSPGPVTINRDRFTILDAISQAGDLSITGKRTNVVVMRKEEGREVAHVVDLTDSRSLLNSPVYYLQQDDIIYVEPGDVKKRQSTVNGNTLLTPSFWISIASFAITVVLLVKNWN